MEQVKSALNLKQIKPTYQRMEIYKYLRDNRNHPTVDMIYESLSKKIPTISKTTIYNTLEMLIQKGMVKPIVITGTEMRYDATTPQHHHFMCEKCGRIIDLELKCRYMGKMDVNGNVIKEMHCYMKGICRDCSNPSDGNDK